MKKNILIIVALLFFISVKGADNSPYISTVIDVHQAPGQFVTASAYLPQNVTLENVTYEQMLEKTSSILVGDTTQNGVISLGAWGGYVTVGFDHTIVNSKGQYDFKVYGNAYYSPQYVGIGGNSEPGIVLVSKDTNKNGIADDEWYELAGSEYAKSTTIHDYKLTYYKPNPIDSSVYWVDNKGNNGYVYKNIYHQQDSYYPLWVNSDSIVFKGERLANNGVNLGSSYLLYAYAYGYADNQPNSTDLCNFKIDWAVDSLGNAVELDGIDFIRVYTGVNQTNGWIGETSTEVAGIVDLHPQATIATGIISLPQNTKVEVYPNPVTEFCSIQSPADATVEIYSISGKLLKKRSVDAGATKINFSTYPVGDYIMKIISTDGVNQFKIIKL